MAEGVRNIRQQLLGVVSIVSAVYFGVSLFSYSQWDPSFFTYTTAAAKNYGGIAGAYISDLFMTFTGFASYILPVVLLVYGIKRVLGRERHRIYAAGVLLLILSGALLLTLVSDTFGLIFDARPGGIAGTYSSRMLERYFSLLGAYILGLAVFFTSSIILMPPVETLYALRRRRSAAVADAPLQPGVLTEELLVSEPVGQPEPAAEPVVQDVLPFEPAAMDIAEEEEEAEAPRERKPRPRVPKPVVKPGGYRLPSVELLTVYDTSAVRPSKEELLSNSALLVEKLADFDVKGEITSVRSGPVVTLYEFIPAPGIKITRVVSLADDLALSLKAQSMRVYPIRGESTIGIEVPNRQREIVSLREILSSEVFRKSNSPLTLALGKDIYGQPTVADLAKMPHLLVAGATGAGKSVSINSMVMSLLYKASPSEVKMLMIDPKLLELSMYEDIPHLISPVITNPKKASEALRKMVIEMERRYRLLAEKGARDIERYNRQMADDAKLPYIVIFIDELADLMFASSKEVEDSIARLAQMARAAGMHLIIATQRPSVDVITGLIKANFPARISFKVFSKIDSRTILDSQGAEQLLGKGDMLFMETGARISRIHGALVTEDEIVAATDFVKAQGVPDFSIFEDIPAAEAHEEDQSEDRDEMYIKAVEFGESVGEVSISSLQRRFKIGYNRAARIMELMEDDGLVGPPKGAGKPREFIRRHS